MIFYLKKQNFKVDRNTQILFGVLDNLSNNRLGITSTQKEIQARCEKNEEEPSILPNLEDLKGSGAVNAMANYRNQNEQSGQST